ncbi:hypothetical protein ACNOYE_29155 [Nannocystaceae bacterium ST9]
MSTRLLLVLLALAPMLACAAPSTVAVNPVSGRVFSTAGSTLWSCDAAGENCTQGVVVAAPEDTAITPDSRLVFISGSSVYVCNDEGQACIPVELPAKMKATGLSVAPSGEIFVVDSKGKLASCTETKCRAVPTGKQPKSE